MTANFSTNPTTSLCRELLPPDVVDSNATLAERFAAKDATAFTALVARYQQFVFRICYGILQHREDAEDATQETFSRVARYLHRWDSQRPLEPWLATVAGNRSRTHLSRRRQHAPLGSIAEPETRSSDHAHAANAMREEISLALQVLPPRQRTAFALFHEKSMAYSEIADHLGCPIGTVKTLVHRARASLISQLRQREVIAEKRHCESSDQSTSVGVPQ